jgi:hypothetical protein
LAVIINGGTPIDGWFGKSKKNDENWGVPHLRKPPFHSISTCSFSAKIYLENLRRHHPLLALLKGTNHCVEAAQLRPLISRRDAIDTIGTANQQKRWIRFFLT